MPISISAQVVQEQSLGAMEYEVFESFEKVLRLDKETTHPWIPGSYFQYVNELDAIAYLNQITSSIKFFDFKSNTVNHTIRIPRIGPNSTGKKPQVMYVHNKDSIFIFSHLNHGELGLYDFNGIKLRSYNLNVVDDLDAPQHYAVLTDVYGSIIVVKDKLFASLRILRSSKVKNYAPLLELDLNSGEVSQLMEPLPYSKIKTEKIPYHKKLLSSRIAYNFEKDHLVVNYPMDHDLFVIDEKNRIQVIDGRNHEFDKFVILKKDIKKYTNQEHTYEVFFKGPRYDGILYNPFTKHYYRVIRLGMEQGDINKWKRGEKVKIFQRFFIDVFNESFMKIASSEFTDEKLLFEQGMFVGPGGLWVLQPQSDDENEMKFTLLEVKLK
ncbi:DUF4221 family protein [Roseivirga sp.]|uniref:DUF4221 family protein n=1 Tax=Roseivirga sp. TaxID=1964215 RepID=UPI003B8CDC91